MGEKWWYTQNEEYLEGPCVSREDAIERGRDHFCGEPFSVCEGARFKATTPAFDIDCIAEAFDDANAEYGPEDEGLSAKWSDEACRELEVELGAVMDAWLDRHGYRECWAINCGPYEAITPEAAP